MRPARTPPNGLRRRRAAAGALTILGLLLLPILAPPSAAQDDYGAAPGRPAIGPAKAEPTKGEQTKPAARRAAPSTAGVRALPPPAHPKELDPAPGGIRDVGPVPASGRGQALALVGATVHTVSGATLEGATVLIEDGTIAAVGSDLDLAPAVRRIPLGGYHVYPSLIAADTVLGLIEVSAVRATDDMREVGDLNPNARAEVSINPSSELLPVTRSSGILVAMTAPRGGLISGTAAVIELDGWTTEDMTLHAPAALILNWPSMRLARSGDARKTLDKQQRALDEKLERLREAFATARAYARGRDAVAAGKAPALDRDVKWDAMVAAVRGELPVLVAAPSILEIKAALAFAEREGLHIILNAGSDVLEVATELRRKEIPVLFADVLAVGREWEPYDINFTVPLRLHEAGVRFCLVASVSGFSAAHTRNLPEHAAKAVAYGLPPAVALRALTLDAAHILGVGDRLGSIEPGKDATLIVTDGDPLDIRTNVHRALIRGREIDLTDRHKRLYERYRMRPRSGLQ